MSDINQIITLGIGTPADIKHFILVGLNTGVAVVTMTLAPNRSAILWYDSTSSRWRCVANY